MFSQFRFRWKDSLATFLYFNFCGLGSSLHCSYWPFIYESYVSQSDVRFFDPKGRKVELVFVRRRFKVHISPKRLVERIQMFWTAVRSCIGVSSVRKKAKSLLWAFKCALNICIVCIRLIMHARVVPRGTGPVWKISNSWHKAKTGRTDSLCGFCVCVASAAIRSALYRAPLSHSFPLYGPPSRQIAYTCIHFTC